jgi:DNA-binding YbaB/EbfC family protein
MKGFGNIMKQAQQMQAKMAEMQEKLAELRIEGSSGGGMVRVVLNGKSELVGVSIDSATIDPEDTEVLEDLIVAAYNDAKQKVEVQTQEKMKEMTGGMGLPPGLF